MTDDEEYQQERAKDLPQRLIWNQERAAALEARRKTGKRVMERCDRCGATSVDAVDGPCFCCTPPESLVYCDDCYEVQLRNHNLLPEPRH